LTQAEGFILGVGAKMFTIAGPVIVYGALAAAVYGLIYWIAIWKSPLEKGGLLIYAEVMDHLVRIHAV
jgi:hypothetical protein